jgi:hypothetical protein
MDYHHHEENVITRYLLSQERSQSSKRDMYQLLKHGVTGRIDTGRAVRNREYQLDETRLDKEQIVNLSITYCKTIVN